METSERPLSLYLDNNGTFTESEFDNVAGGSSSMSENRLSTLVTEVLHGNWENTSDIITDWQRDELKGLLEPGVRCLLSMWFINQKNMTQGSYCNATWDNVYCWPPSPNGRVVSRQCSDILKVEEEPFKSLIHGNAVRVCLENGTWLWGNWTNYTECADSYEEFERIVVFTTMSFMPTSMSALLLEWIGNDGEEEKGLVVIVQYILFIGSILSLVCLGAALFIFYYFKCLWCDRVTVHAHLIVALLLRSILLIVITEPFIFNRSSHYRNVDIICKIVLSVNLYATVASINWMFIQGIYLHSKLTTNVFDKGSPFKVYYTIGWIFPLVLITIYAIVMEIYHPVQCWKDYSERSEIWILLGPIIVALLANLLFLINIMRILMTKVQRSCSSSDAMHFRRAFKATIILFPLLGINNLLFLYNPGGEYNKFFVILNTICGSTQGIFVSILYCYLSKDVRDAIYRQYRRFLSRSTFRQQARSVKRQESTLTRSFHARATFRTTQTSRRMPESGESFMAPPEQQVDSGNPNLYKSRTPFRTSPPVVSTAPKSFKGYYSSKENNNGSSRYHHRQYHKRRQQCEAGVGMTSLTPPNQNRSDSKSVSHVCELHF